MSDPNASAAASAPELMDPGLTPRQSQTPAPDLAQEVAVDDNELALAGPPRSLGKDALHDLIRNPIFIVSAVFIAIFVLMAAFPSLFTGKLPNTCDLALSRIPPKAGAIFGYDNNGCDVYARTIYGARPSIMVGILTTLLTLLVGVVTGTVAGYYGGWTDTIVSRITDIFFAIPLLLGAILIMTSLPSEPDGSQVLNIGKVVLALAVLGWTALTRIMRSSVIQVKNADYVQAARALGAKNSWIIRHHILPNSLGPVIVVAALGLGGYIGAEATLSFLGVGLPATVVSWGGDIAVAQKYLRTAPYMLFFPAAFLSMAVLAFIMLGDAVRDALNPRLR